MYNVTNNTKNIVNKGYFTNSCKNKYNIGLQGQKFLEKRSNERGYVTYKRNYKKIGIEIDLIIYKYIPSKDLLIVRILEVKTRNILSLRYDSDLEWFGIDKKWMKIRKYIYVIVSELKQKLNLETSKHIIRFDLAVISFNNDWFDKKGEYGIYKYIENADLLI